MQTSSEFFLILPRANFQLAFFFLRIRSTKFSVGLSDISLIQFLVIVCDMAGSTTPDYMARPCLIFLLTWEYLVRQTHETSSSWTSELHRCRIHLFVREKAYAPDAYKFFSLLAYFQNSVKTLLILTMYKKNLFNISPRIFLYQSIFYDILDLISEIQNLSVENNINWVAKFL